MNSASEYGSFHKHSNVDNDNVASGGSHVDQQIGVNYGETAFHYESTYHINQSDPPERRHDIAFNHLAGGTPRFAERLFGELLWNGHATTERAYYYILSVLSDRSFHEINGELLASIVNARKVCQSLGRDDWREALDAVWRFLRHVRHEADGHPEGEHLDDALSAFGALPTERQDEITRHLDMVLGSLVQERLQAAYAHRVVAERMRPDRAARAWKFFQPDPAKPRKHVPARTNAKRADWVRAIAGGCGALLGVVSLLAGLFQIGVVLGIPLFAAGSYLVLRYGVQRESLALHIAAKQHEVAAPVQRFELRSPGHWVSSGFVREIDKLVDARFSEARPHVAGDWPGYTAGIRAHLKRRLVDLYGNAQVKPAAVNWLISWHARRVAAGWGAQALFQYQLMVGAATRATTLFRVGFGVGAVSLAAMLAADQVGAAFFLGVGGFFAATAIVRMVALQRVDELRRAEAEELYNEELRGYEDWVNELADRPSDAEMARWLAMDKIFLKNDAIKRAGLISEDLVEHVVMTEGAKGAMRARVLHGPPRYSAYVVQIFLLTRSGVRETRVELDFLTGAARNERRNLYRYDALASASVTESGMRTTIGDGSQSTEVERLRSRTFRLTLVNGRDVTVIAENFRNVEDTMLEDEAELFLVALQTSGIESALPILESVAAEGTDWIAREHERRARWSRDWYE